MQSALLLIVLLFSLSGCDSEPPLTPLNSNATILSFGDSLTYGTGANREQSYPAQLQLLTGIKVINAGTPGEISANGLKRLPALLDQHRPQLLILCHGGNDLLRKLSTEQLRGNLQQMIELAQQRGTEVLLISVPKPTLLLSPQPVYAELAEQHLLVDPITVLADILGDNRLKSDAIHPNAQGYRQLAEAVAEKLKQQGAISDS
ncbi:MAG: arylesterase [Motiliproteus sp.]